VIGHANEAHEYEALAERILDAFNRRFLQAGTGRYGPATQACQAVPLFMGLVPDAERKAALDVLVDDVLTANNGHLSTGIFGTRFLLMGLTHAGRADVAYTIASQKTFPGWGYMLERGATTLWEHWEYSDNTFSHNHPMFGSVSEWLVKAVAGIMHEGETCGFDRIVIRPAVVGDLTWATGEYRSVRGRVASAWKIAGGRLHLDVTIPVGSTATVYMPATSADAVTEGGKPAGEATGVEFVRMVDGAAVYRVESGSYRFSSGR
jgi:alpha-L-rhamnosidase